MFTYISFIVFLDFDTQFREEGDNILGKPHLVITGWVTGNNRQQLLPNHF